MNKERDLKQLLTNIVNGKSNDICRLCLQETQGESVNLNQTVIFENKNGESKTIAEILTIICGTMYESNADEFSSVCVACAKSAIDSYLFLDMCHNSTNELDKLLLDMDRCLAKKVDVKNSKSMYIFLKDRPRVILDRKHHIETPGDVTKRVRKLISSQQKKTRRIKKSEDELDDATVQIQCTDCGEIFESERQFNRHQSTAHFGTKYHCDMCVMTFSTLSKLKYHVERKHADKIYECPQCSKKFGSVGLVKEHLTFSHTPCECSICGKAYDNRQSLKAHEERHVKKECEKCGKSYKNRLYFEEHRRQCLSGNLKLRTKRPIFCCDICGKGYAQKGALRVHINFEHGNAKAFVCEWCGKKFSARSKLAAHSVKHTRERNHKCEYCSGCFVTKEALVYHTRRHTGERPYPCDQCDEKFISASRRLEHVRRKHVGPTVECKFCSTKFLSQTALRLHAKRHLDPNSKLFCENLVKENLDSQMIPIEELQILPPSKRETYIIEEYVQEETILGDE